LRRRAGRPQLKRDPLASSATTKSPRQLLLFDTLVRSDPSLRRHTESTYQFLNRCSKPGCDDIRTELERWFALYPDDHQGRLRIQFLSDFHSAFFELLLHQLLLQMGYDIEIEPDVPGTDNHPDFLATRGTTRFYLEAAVATDKTDAERRMEAAENALLDSINTISSPNFFLGVRRLEIPQGRRPSANKIVNALQAYLSELDPDLLTEQLKAGGLDSLPTWKYKDDNVSLEIEPVPKSPAARGKPGLRAIGMYPMRSRWGGTDKAVRSKLLDKAGKYGRLDHPYIIAINSISEWGTERGEVLESLFGSERLVVRPNEEVRADRAADGLFIGPAGPRNTRVSGVLVATAYAWALPQSRFELFHHPWAAKPLPRDALPLPQVLREGELLREQPGEAIHRILGIPDEWPNGPLAEDA